MPDNRRFKGRGGLNHLLGLVGAATGGKETAKTNEYFGRDQEEANIEAGKEVNTTMPYQKERFRDTLVGSNANELNQQYTTAKILGQLQNQQALELLKQRMPLEQAAELEMMRQRILLQAQAEVDTLKQRLPLEQQFQLETLSKELLLRAQSQISTAKKLGKISNKQALDLLQKRLPIEEGSDLRRMSNAEGIKRASEQQRRSQEQTDRANALLALADSGAMGQNILTAKLRNNLRLLGNVLQQLPELVQNMNQLGTIPTAQHIAENKGEFDLRSGTIGLNRLNDEESLRQQTLPHTTAKTVADAQFAENVSTNRLANKDLYNELAQKELQGGILGAGLVPLQNNMMNLKGQVIQVPPMSYDMMTPYQQQSLGMRQQQAEQSDPLQMLQRLQQMQQGMTNTTAKPLPAAPRKRLVAIKNGVPIYVEE